MEDRKIDVLLLEIWLTELFINTCRYRPHMIDLELVFCEVWIFSKTPGRLQSLAWIFACCQVLQLAHRVGLDSLVPLKPPPPPDHLTSLVLSDSPDLELLNQ